MIGLGTTTYWATRFSNLRGPIRRRSATVQYKSLYLHTSTACVKYFKQGYLYKIGK